MITVPDFKKKQIIVIFFKEGEKLSFSNDNLVVKNKEDKIILQCTCYRIFLIMGVGYCSITSGLLQRARRFNFSIALFTQTFKLYSFIAAEKEGNTLLRKRQYEYHDLDIAKLITKNKISTQYRTLILQRNKSDGTKSALDLLGGYFERVDEQSTVSSIMAYEGLASKAYFANHFDNVNWKGRQPRIKADHINSVLDIGYTLLFSFIDAILLSYGFDTYCGVLHRQFYMRKSLTCDIVEPFRTLVDSQIKKSINLRQIAEEDFEVYNHQYRLKWSENSKYMKFLMSPIVENKDVIFKYIQGYYRAFIKGGDLKEFPYYREGILEYGNYKL